MIEVDFINETDRKIGGRSESSHRKEEHSAVENMDQFWTSATEHSIRQ
jgi:hypothetical protein